MINIRLLLAKALSTIDTINNLFIFLSRTMFKTTIMVVCALALQGCNKKEGQAPPGGAPAGGQVTPHGGNPPPPPAPGGGAMPPAGGKVCDIPDQYVQIMTCKYLTVPLACYEAHVRIHAQSAADAKYQDACEQCLADNECSWEKCGGKSKEPPQSTEQEPKELYV